MQKFILLIILAAALTFSCVKKDTAVNLSMFDGSAGMSVDVHGNLVINAPVFTTDETMAIPEIKPLNKDINIEVEVFFISHWSLNSDYAKIASGSLSNGNLSITIPKPDENDLAAVDIWYNSELIKSGNSVRIGFIEISSPLGCLRLYSNHKIDLSRSEGEERAYPKITGDLYEFSYSEGDAILSGSYLEPGGYGFGADLEDVLDIKLTIGWNSYYYSRIFNEETNTLTVTGVSNNPMSDAMWLLW